jgi:DNA replication and repair protein RecF
VSPTEYGARIEAVVYSNDRIRALQSSVRERRAYIDRGGSRLWPAYRQTLRDYERTLAQRNAALRAQGRDLGTWNERLAETGGALRHRRAEYAARLAAALAAAEPLARERVGLTVGGGAPAQDPAAEGERLLAQIAAALPAERRAGRSLCGPHRDPVAMTVDERDVAEVSSGQARTALLSLLLATLDVYRSERRSAPVALLDDLDSELDDERTRSVCRAVVRRGQTLVTTAHPAWTRALGAGRRFVVEGGRVAAASC